LKPAGTPRSRTRRNTSAWATLSTRLRNGSGNWNGAALFAAQLRRGERRTAESAFVGGLADQHEHPALVALGHAAAQDPLGAGDAERHHVDQTVASKPRSK
jgi:hypothetical protein